MGVQGSTAPAHIHTLCTVSTDPGRDRHVQSITLVGRFYVRWYYWNGIHVVSYTLVLVCSYSWDQVGGLVVSIPESCMFVRCWQHFGHHQETLSPSQTSPTGRDQSPLQPRSAPVAADIELTAAEGEERRWTRYFAVDWTTYRYWVEVLERYHLRLRRLDTCHLISSSVLQWHAWQRVKVLASMTGCFDSSLNKRNRRNLSVIKHHAPRPHVGGIFFAAASRHRHAHLARLEFTLHPSVRTSLPAEGRTESSGECNSQVSHI